MKKYLIILLYSTTLLLSCTLGEEYEELSDMWVLESKIGGEAGGLEMTNWNKMVIDGNNIKFFNNELLMARGNIKLPHDDKYNLKKLKIRLDYRNEKFTDLYAETLTYSLINNKLIFTEPGGDTFSYSFQRK
jgi:hypothetical protein